MDEEGCPFTMHVYQIIMIYTLNILEFYMAITFQ